MTTQRTSRALAREAAGLFLVAFGALGVLAALGALHWAVGLSTAMAGLLATGILIPDKPDGPRWARAVRAAATGIGYGGLTVCAYALAAPLGWLGAALAVLLVGLWLATGSREGS